MDWIDRMNQAVAYIEEHLEEDVDSEALGRIACCSAFHFQRMFAYIADVTLSEYIRRRRMSRAAFDLQTGDDKVIDVGLKYGYTSPTAFTRAFQSVHGISPSQAKKEGAVVKSFPPLSFKIIIKGVEEMDYKIVKKDAFRIVGISQPMQQEIEENFKTVPLMWERVARENLLPVLIQQMEGEPAGVLGVSACMGEQWRYYIAVASGKPVPEGMEEYEIPACTWAVFTGSGPMPGAIQELEKRAVLEWLPTSGYEYGNAPDIEVYVNADPANAQFEVWLPVVKK